jgi:hypothetical protein
MPDPHKDLAEIIEPAAPPVAAAPADHTPSLALAFASLAPLLAAAWFWRRRAPLRALRRLSRAPDVAAAAAELARLMQSRAAPQPWRRELERLRFARPAPDAAATLARLCREAEAFVRAGDTNK